MGGGRGLKTTSVFMMTLSCFFPLKVEAILYSTPINSINIICLVVFWRCLSLASAAVSGLRFLSIAVARIHFFSVGKTTMPLQCISTRRFEQVSFRKAKSLSQSVWGGFGLDFLDFSMLLQACHRVWLFYTNSTFLDRNRKSVLTELCDLW